MSTNSILSKIRAEIERRRDICKAIFERESDTYYQGKAVAYDETLSFLDTLSEEPDKGLDVTNFCKPIDPSIAQCVADHWHEMFGEVDKHPKNILPPSKECDHGLREPLESEDPDKSLEEAARHSEILTYPMPDDGDIEKVMKVQEVRIFHEIGFIAGAEWQKEQDLAEMAQSKSPLSVAYANRCFENGKHAMKEQMLKDAVEGEICGRVYDHINVRFADGVCKYLEPKNISHIPADVSKYNIGDKVRIVVLKEEDEK